MKNTYFIIQTANSCFIHCTGHWKKYEGFGTDISTVFWTIAFYARFSLYTRLASSFVFGFVVRIIIFTIILGRIISIV